MSTSNQSLEVVGDVPRSTYIRRAIEKVSAHTLIIADSKSMSEIKSESIHFVVTSPPYWNLKKYGEEGLGPNQAYAKYLYEIQSVLKEIKRVMAPGRFVAINVGTAVSNDGMKPINAVITQVITKILEID
jgi:DNA modification methylase